MFYKVFFVLISGHVFCSGLCLTTYGRLARPLLLVSTPVLSRDCDCPSAYITSGVIICHVEISMPCARRTIFKVDMFRNSCLLVFVFHRHAYYDRSWRNTVGRNDSFLSGYSFKKDMIPNLFIYCDKQTWYKSEYVDLLYASEFLGPIYWSLINNWHPVWVPSQFVPDNLPPLDNSSLFLTANKKTI